MHPHKSIFYFLFFIASFGVLSVIFTGCAQIGAPTGGPKDSIPPVLIKAIPEMKTTNFNGNRIVFEFDEYVDVKDVQSNLQVSPYQRNMPSVDYKLKTVTVKFKDTLLPNTTYFLDFGKAIVDNNEGNALQNFNYVFSTGSNIDSLTLKGKVILAETGKADSTLLVLLYRNAVDSTVQTKKPNYITKLSGDGTFIFKYMPNESFNIYALLDGDGSKTYNATTETFAFIDTKVTPGTANDIVLHAYAQEKEIEKKKPTPVKQTSQEKKLKYTNSLSGGPHDLLLPVELTFPTALKHADLTKILLTDTAYSPISGASVTIDSTQKIITIANRWKEESLYKLIVPKEAIADSLGLQLAKSDTLQFITKRKADYGKLVLKFPKYKADQHVVIQLVKENKIYRSISVTGKQWSDDMFPPGEYDVRILYDANNNGIWDPGNYMKKQQPEIVTAFDKKLAIKANWDTERDIEF